MIFLPVISSVVLLASCKSMFDREFTVEVVFDNKTETEVQLISMGYVVNWEKSEGYSDTIIERTIPTNRNLILTIDLPTTEKKPEPPIGLSLFMYNNCLGDSVMLCFNDNKYLKYYQNNKEANEIYNLDNYTFVKINNTHFKYTYTITEEDYNNALPIENGEE